MVAKSSSRRTPAAGAWERFWFSENDGRQLAAFRIAHGACLLLYLMAWWRWAPEWLTPAGFHLPDESVAPMRAGMLVPFGCLQFGSALLFIAGWKPRLSAAFCFGCLIAVTLIDRVASFSINSIFLFTLCVFIAFPTQSKMGRVELAPQRLLQVALVVIYFSSGWNKAVFGDWLESKGVLETAMKGIYMTDAAAFFLRTAPRWCWTVAQGWVLAFELLAPVLFFSRKTRMAAIFFGCAFHLGIALFMDQLIYFSLQMMSFYVLFLPDEIWEWTEHRWQRVTSLLPPRSGQRQNTVSGNANY